MWLAGDEAKQHSGNLLARRSEIESALGFALDWQELPEKTACRIAVWYPDAVLGDETRWDEFSDWFARHLIAMDSVLRPVVKGLP